MTTHPANRRSLALIVAGFALLLVAGAGWMYASAPKSPGIPWYLSGMGGANSSLAESQINDPLVVRVYLKQWPVDRSDDSWLAVSVDENPNAVTITLRISPDYGGRKEIAGPGGWYDTGGWVNVHLHAPVGDRALVDGATGQRATSNP